MPFVTVETNLNSSDLPEDFGKQFSEFLADLFTKPLARISVTLIPGRPMWRGGSDAPVMQISVAAIGIFTNETTQSFSEQITSYIQSKTGLPLDRVLIVFTPLQPWQVGMNGTVVS